MYSGKSGCSRANVVLIRLMLLFSGKEVVFGQRGCIRAMWFYSGKRGFIHSKG